MRLAPAVLLLPHALVATSSFEGIAQNMIMITDATDPPAVRAVSSRTLEISTIIEYTREDLALLGVPPLRDDGVNRTLRPSGIVLMEAQFSDTIFWADAGAGAILGMRFDSSGLRVVTRGLSMPETLVLDTSAETWQVIQGHALYWGDSGSNKIQRCRLDLSAGGAGNCTYGVTDVKTNVRNVAGLALNPVTSILYWADGELLRVYALPLNAATGVASTAPTALVEVVSFVAMPAGLAMELQNSGSLYADRLYVLDQASPATLSRTWLNGNDTQTLVQYGLSRPRAIGLARDHHFFGLADSGTRQLFVGSTGQDIPMLREVYTASNFEPRGVAIRTDAELLISLTGAPNAAQDQSSAGASGRRRRGAREAGVAATASAAAALVVGALVGRRRV